MDLGPPKQRLVFAALAVDLGHSVSIETLVDRVWDDEPPGDARGALYTYLTRLRRVLAAARTDAATPITVGRGHAGYVLSADPDRFDLQRLRRLAERAYGLPADHPDRSRLLREALDLWAGDPLNGLPGGWAERVREGLRQDLVQVLIAWADSEIERGHPGRVADRLAATLHRDPLAEPVVQRRMRALALSGRRAESLELYARTRALLAEELGIDPGADLQELHRGILRGELHPAVRAETPPPADPVPPAAPRRPPSPGAPGCQLPADLPDHVGCEPEISRALSALQPGSQRLSGTAGPVVILSGPGGVGKTAVSVRLGYLLRECYPDGQIFVSLGDRHGDSSDALDRALRALGVPSVRRLRTVEDKLGEYRSALSGRRILLVLDSARHAGQVRPLVPGGTGSALIVSSRVRMTTIPGAECIEVPLLDDAGSRTLLERIVGAERSAAEPEAVAGLIRMCAGLPLALRIVGARIAARPHRRIAHLADRMRDESNRLDEMTADGLAVRVSVAVSYAGLDNPARRTFRLLGLLGVTDFSSRMATGLIGGPHDVVEEQLEQLADARLVTVVTEPTGQSLRYRMHDLVRLFAYEQAQLHPEDELRFGSFRELAAAA
ncbi:DNA-binding SARP family transcriptional activator [Actinoplanes octamycinicus]|uniref:DNA-binding SARP family transcriptional activator n=1 Tax=Actinoplanes octamycinicus TaxID=135948 RepID=A0A7W7H184_9ACTN|nr:BTAD domain-containing putative transcriptional regulator [Actinoplanes octamycinicus]MBB4742043.1 DNA-binding SARP family transcriptional activator [Actinoplanes octamycinicus]